ncbi:MAG: AAA family ATPase [Thermoplasmata archaeon]
MRVISVTGMPGSGKEELVKIAIQEGMKVVRMGDVVRAWVKNRGIELTDANVGRIANEEREKHGLGIWAERTVPLVKGEIVLIDGIRGESELEAFKKAFGGELTVIGVDASPEIRYERIRKRKRKDTTVSWEAFSKRDSRELGWGIGNAMVACDHVIVNEGTLKEFQEEVRSLLESLR